MDKFTVTDYSVWIPHATQEFTGATFSPGSSVLGAVLIKDEPRTTSTQPSIGETFGLEEVTGSHENTRASFSVSGLGTNFMVPGVPCVDRGNWGRERDLIRVLQRKFWQVSRLTRSSRIQRCRCFSERVGPRTIVLNVSQVSSCSKRFREITTKPIRY